MGILGEKSRPVRTSDFLFFQNCSAQPIAEAIQITPVNHLSPSGMRALRSCGRKNRGTTVTAATERTNPVMAYFSQTKSLPFRCASSVDQSICQKTIWSKKSPGMRAMTTTGSFTPQPCRTQAKFSPMLARKTVHESCCAARPPRALRMI